MHMYIGRDHTYIPILFPTQTSYQLLSSLQFLGASIYLFFKLLLFTSFLIKLLFKGSQSVLHFLQLCPLGVENTHSLLQ